MAKRKVPNVVRGGIAIPLKGKTNYYYMQGRKHVNGGIDIGENPRTGLEVEDGEIMHINNNEVKVFSAQPFLNGKSPAQRVMEGDNPNKVFKAQEDFKDKNHINDDGTKKKQIGGNAKPKFNDWYKTIPEEINDTTNYNLRRAYETLPYNTLENWRTGNSHLNSVVRTNDGNYEFLKSKNHPTYRKEIDWYNSPGAASFREEYFLDDSTEYPKYIKRNKKRMGGLNKDKNNKVKSKSDRLYSVTVNGKTKLRMLSSTGDRTKADKGTEKELPKYSIKDLWKDTKESIKDYWRDNKESIILDGLGLTSNIAGSIISNRVNNRILNRMEYAPQPVARQAAKLKTRININPQLDKMRENLSAYERNIDANTASSRVALARKQRARIADTLNTNELYADKENKETSLINQDRLNQQSITSANVQDYNTWKQNKTAFRNTILEKKAENDVSLINNINAGVQDVVDKSLKRRTENQTISAMALANPNLPIEMLYTQGLVNKKTYDAYKKAYRSKNKDKNVND